MWRKFMQYKFGTKVHDKHKAFQIKRKLSLLYAFVGWNCFGILFYLILKSQTPTDSTERRNTYRFLTGMPDKMHVYQVSGLKLKEFDVTFPKEENESTEIEKETTKVDEQ